MFFQVSLETNIAPENPWVAYFQVKKSQGGYKTQNVALHFCFPTNRSIRIMIIDSSPSSGQKMSKGGESQVVSQDGLRADRYTWSDLGPTINGINMGFTGV